MTLVLVALGLLSIVSLPYVSGQASAIQCIPGELNVILAAPHGGYEEPDEIRDRDAGCYIDDDCVWSHSCGEKDEDRYI